LTLKSQSAPVNTTTMLNFDYQTKCQRISKEVKTTLKAKFDAAIDNFQKLIDSLDQKVDQKSQHHMEMIKTLQTDMATQDNHTQQLAQLAKMLYILVSQIHMLLDQKMYPMPMNGIGQS